MSGAVTHSEAKRGAPDLTAAIHKAARRLLPFLLLLYVLAFLDRVNVGYAKQAMMRDTGLSEAVYAFGASVFFIGYAIFEVPSNLIMHRVGARLWMSRIMITWGLVSAAMLFATTAPLFYTLRFLLGVAEAGFFPGVILYLTYWFPDQYRGRMMGLFYFGAPLAQIFGGPLSGLLLEMNGVGNLRGWQWMFLVEGLMASAVGVWALKYLTDRPSDATWLSVEQRAALENSLGKAVTDHTTNINLLRNPRILYFALIYCLIQMSVYGVTFYLPARIARLLDRDTGFIVGVVSAIPWVCALIAAYTLPRLAGRFGSRSQIAALALALSGTGIGISSADVPLLALAALCVATAGFIGAQPIFWTYPVNELTGLNAAAGIALINTFGALGGFLAPNLKTITERIWASTVAGQLALAATSVAAAILMLCLKEPTRLESRL